MCKTFKLINLFKCFFFFFNNFCHMLIIFCSFRPLYSTCLTFFLWFISLLEFVKPKCVFCSLKIQYYLSLLINSCFDEFRLSLSSWILIKVTLQSSFLEIRAFLIICYYILICNLCPSVNTTALPKRLFFVHLRLK